MDGLYAERLLDASDVCRNCFRLRLVERTEVRSTGLTANPESVYTRHERTTDLDHHPSDPPTQDKHLFCECGVIGPHSRAWADADVDRERLKDLLKHMIQSAEHKGISLDRGATVKYALATWDGEDVDQTLSDALDHGSTVATVTTETGAETAAD